MYSLLSISNFDKECKRGRRKYLFDLSGTTGKMWEDLSFAGGTGHLPDCRADRRSVSALINEVENEELKNQLSDYQAEFLIEKEELETSLKSMQAEYEAEYRRESALMRM